jgi:alpha-1,2-mannosyltransferase
MGDGGVAQHDPAIPPGARWALGGLSAAVVGLFALVLAHQWQVDFEVYRTGGLHVLGTGLYAAQVDAAHRNLLFTYTPLAAMAFWPFSFLSPWAGQVVWDAVNIAALAALVAVSVAAARRRPVRRADWQLALIALAPLSLLIWPVRYGFELGQINVVLVLMIVADLSVDISWRGRRLPRGVLVGVAAAIKLTPLVFIPYLLVTRQWVTARNAVLTFCATTGVMFAVAPGASWSYFSRYAFDVRRIGDSSITDNQTLRAALARTGLPIPHLVVDVVLVAVLCAGLALAALAYQRSSPLLGILLCAATGLLVSPISWQHHYVWCVPLLVWLALGVDGPRRGEMWAAVTTLVFVVTPPGRSVHTNVADYVRENAYVLATLGFMGLAGALLWARSRLPTSPKPAATPPPPERDETTPRPKAGADRC